MVGAPESARISSQPVIQPARTPTQRDNPPTHLTWSARPDTPLTINMSMLDKIRERGAEMGRRLSVGLAGGGGEAPRRVSVGTLCPGANKDCTHYPTLNLSPHTPHKRTSLDCTPGVVNSHLYTAMVGALLANPTQHLCKVRQHSPFFFLLLHKNYL